MDNIKIGSFIKQLRKQKGLTQLQVAEMLHITDRAVSKWERGLCAPDIALLQPLSKILDVSILELISGSYLTSNEIMHNSTIAVIDYSNQEIKNKTNKNRRMINICIGIASFIFILIIFCFIYVHIQEEKASERLFMNHMYAKLNEITWTAEEILSNTFTQSEYDDSFKRLHYAFYDASEILENGMYFVDESIPGVASWWFLEKAAYITNNLHVFVSDQGTLTNDGITFLNELRSDMQEIIAPLTGEDQMNIKQTLSMSEFSAIIYDFYCTH